MKKLIYAFAISIILLATSVYGAGSTNFASPPDDTAYNATSWNGSRRAPTKNAVRDAIEAISPGAAAVIPSSYLDTDGTLAADSNVKVATQKATKAYADLMIPKTTFVAAGDLIYGSAAGTPAILTHPAAAYYLLATNAATTFAWLASSADVIDMLGAANDAEILSKIGAVASASVKTDNTDGSSGGVALPMIASDNHIEEATSLIGLTVGGTTTPTIDVTGIKSAATTGYMTITGPTAGNGRAMTIPDADFTVARTDAGQTFTGVNVFTAPTFTTSITPTSAGASTFGTADLEWGNAYFTDSAVIYFQADQSVTVTSAATGLTFNKPIIVADVTNDNAIQVTNNSGGRAPTASKYEIYPDTGAWKANANGTEYNIPMAGACTALTPGEAVTLTVAATNCYTDTVTDNQDQTITFSGAGYSGQEITIIFTTAGSADEVITFHATLVSSTGTLTLGTDAGKYYVIRFISNGTHWFEVSRTAVQT